MLDISFTFDTSHLARLPLNEDAPRNIPLMSFARDTSQFEMSASNSFAPENMRLMSLTRDTSHFPIGPFGLFKHLPLCDSLRHATIALLSCTPVNGENAVVGVGGAVVLNSNYRVERKSDMAV